MTDHDRISLTIHLRSAAEHMGMSLLYGGVADASVFSQLDYAKLEEATETIHKLWRKVEDPSSNKEFGAR